MDKIELLAPAGDLERLKVAFAYGADAVFLGGKEYSLRSRASNFDLDDIKEACKIAKKYKGKIHVTCNIFPLNSDLKDLEKLENYLKELEKAGVTGYVGKVNMDRNGGVNLQETTEESISETIDWLNKCHFEHIKPIITPRFTPSCTNELMEELGKIANERHLPIQSHLSENRGEIAWVKELHPDCLEYWESYKKYGLWNNKTLMAHCIFSSERERKAIKDTGVYVVHCAASNQNLISGFAQIKKMINEGVNIVLGSDIAGGDHLSMFDNVADSIRASKARNILDNWETGFLTVEEAFYLGTSVANSFFDEKPGFAPGNELHCIVLDDQKLVSAKPLTIKERFERAVYLRQEDAIYAVYSAGRKVL